MKNKLLKLIIIGFLILLTVGYIYYFRPMVDDELFSYGFSYNIINGLIPYKDFNMVITPLFPYLLSFGLIFLCKLLCYIQIIQLLYFSILHVSLNSFLLFLIELLMALL